MSVKSTLKTRENWHSPSKAESSRAHLTVRTVNNLTPAVFITITCSQDEIRNTCSANPVKKE